MTNEKALLLEVVDKKVTDLLHVFALYVTDFDG
jgi:hypothetical protein